MACNGLHCAGCSGGVAVPPIAFAFAFGAAWVADHLLEVAAVSAACGVLAVAAVVALMRWQDRRQAGFAAQASLWTVSAEAVPLRASAELPRPQMPAIDPPRQVVVNIFGLTDAEQAEVIRRAIEGN